MKFTKEFDGVVAGEFYPKHFMPGDECPPELVAAALATGVVDAKPAKSAPGKTGK